MNINDNYVLPLVISLSFILAGCSDSGSGAGGVNNSPADLDSEIYSQKSWDILSPDVIESDSVEGFSESFTEIVGIDEYSCINEQHSFTSNPKEFISIQPDSSIVWLGNLIQGQSHLVVGSLRELSIRERAPMGISIDLLRGDNYRQVESPSLTSVNAAIGELVESAVNAGHQASSDVFYEFSEAHSSAQASLNLGFSAEYLGFQASASLAVSNQANEHTYYAYFIQKAFTVSMELPTAPHDVVTDAFTNEKLQALIDKGDIGEDNPALYVSNIGYGRILVYKMTSTHEKNRIQAAINASYNGVFANTSGYTDVDIQSTLDSAKIEIAAFGGDVSNIEALIRSGKLSDYFIGDTELSSMRPISFEVRRLMENQTAGLVRTSEYDVKSCTFERKTVPPIGEIMKLHLSSVYIGADCDGIGAGDIYGQFRLVSFDNNTNEVVTKPIYDMYRVTSVGVSSGNHLTFAANSIVVNRYYDQTFKLSGELFDEDGGARGADDIVGLWAGTDMANLLPGEHRSDATNNCDGNNPALFYRLERQGYIYQ